jgi:hypothetical protein
MNISCVLRKGRDRCVYQDRIMKKTSVVDPNYFDADPDSTYHPDADPDPDPSFQIKAQTLDFYFMRIRMRIWIII